MNIDGNVFADLKRAPAGGVCIVVSGEAGSGKSTILRRVVGAASNEGWGVGVLGAGEVSAPRVVVADYHSIVRQIGRPWAVSPAASVVVIDDVHIVWQLLAANGHTEGAQALFAACPCSLLLASLPSGHINLSRHRCPTIVHDLAAPSSTAMFRVLCAQGGGEGWRRHCSELVSIIPKGTTYQRLMEVVAMSRASASFVDTFRALINPALHHATHSALRLPATHRDILNRLRLLCRLHVDDVLRVDRGVSVVDNTRPPSGIVLHGASGAGKTALVAQLEVELPGVRFLQVTASSLFGKYLGESEAKLRTLFSEARAAAPCVLVIDDIDVLGQRRSLGEDSGTDVTRRVLTALLCELDGFEEKEGVLVVGTTSVISTLDGALLRQGRLESVIEVPVLSESDCRELLCDFLPSIGASDRIEQAVALCKDQPLSTLNAVLKAELEEKLLI